MAEFGLIQTLPFPTAFCCISALMKNSQHRYNIYECMFSHTHTHTNLNLKIKTVPLISVLGLNSKEIMADVLASRKDWH